jgi:ribonuclease-3
MISRERKKELTRFLKELKVRFHNFELLDQALSHRSWINEVKKGGENNEKLEFLGDSVLGLVVTEFLYKTYPDYTEGDLARIKSFVVSERSLSKIAKTIRMQSFIRIGKGEEISGGRRKKTILADTFEAFLGALYLDSNYKRVQSLIISLFATEIELVTLNQHDRGYKTLLQEFVQKKHKTCPSYRLKGNSGPEHDKTFFIEVFVNNRMAGYGEGKSKKEAEQKAAQNAYQKFNSPLIRSVPKSNKSRKKRHNG